MPRITLSEEDFARLQVELNQAKLRREKARSKSGCEGRVRDIEYQVEEDKPAAKPKKVKKVVEEPVVEVKIAPKKKVKAAVVEEEPAAKPKKGKAKKVKEHECDSDCDETNCEFC